MMMMAEMAERQVMDDVIQKLPRTGSGDKLRLVRVRTEYFG